MKDKSPQTIILGAGLAGLSAAYHSGFPVYEARDRVGGTSDSVVKDDFVFDMGIHVLQSKIDSFHELMEDLGVQLDSHQRRGHIYSHGNYAAYPFQINTSHLPFPLRLRCIAGYLFRPKQSEPDNYHDWIVKSFGRGFAETFLVPYSEKFWRSSLKEMTFEWTGGRVPVPRLWDIIIGAFRDRLVKVGTNPIFQYPSLNAAGFTAIAAALAARTRNIRLGMRATSIDVQMKTVSFNDGSAVQSYEKLISTVPLPDLIDILNDVPDEIRQLSERLKFNSIAVVNLGILRKDLSDSHWIHFPEKDISFFRISFPSNFGSGVNPKDTTPIQAEVSYDWRQPPAVDELLEEVRRDLIGVGVLTSDDEVVFRDVVFVKYGYVIYDKERKDVVANIHKFLNKNAIYPCGRFGAWEYLWSDESALSGKETAELILDQHKRGDAEHGG